MSSSHIIPENLGGAEELKGFVCKNCNDEFGKTFEATTANELSFYRFFIQIKTKGKIAKTEAILNIFGNKVPVKPGSGGIPRNVRPIFIEDKIIVGAATRDDLIRIMKKYEKTGVPFDKNNITRTTAELIFPSQKIPVNSDDFLRLASKIGFEKYCLLRPNQIFGDEYCLIRDFIHKGIYNESKKCFLIFDYDLIKLIELPFPYHGVLLIRYDRYEAAIITIFGLFNYFVILNSNAIVLQEEVHYFYTNPKLKETKEALILRRSYSLKEIFKHCNRSIGKNEEYNLRLTNKYAREKFNKFIENKT